MVGGVDELADSSPLQGDPDALRRCLGDDGYLFFRGLLPAAAMRAAADGVLAELHRGGWVDDRDIPSGRRRALNSREALDDPAFRAAIAGPAFNQIPYLARLRSLVRMILGPRAFSYPAKVLRAVYPERPPGVARGRHVHQDYSVSGVQDMLTTWVPLMEIPVQLGGLGVRPGSHLGPPLRPRVLGQGERGWATTDYRAGDVLIFIASPRTPPCLTAALHCAFPATSAGSGPTSLPLPNSCLALRAGSGSFSAACLPASHGGSRFPAERRCARGRSWSPCRQDRRAISRCTPAGSAGSRPAAWSTEAVAVRQSNGRTAGRQGARRWPWLGRDGRALLKAVHAAAGSDPDLAFLARLQQAGVLRAVLVQNYFTVTGEQGREVIKRREAQVEGLPPGRSRITSPCDTDARRGAGAGRQGGATDPATKPSRRRDPSAGRLGRVFPGLPHVSLVGAGPEASRWS